ncbi:hypothetical protein BB558_004907 [Smittium angustum]|uniref:RRM domain-containing protein n=1 Tax=Smittium angustum TaxID=133377 RepID=A0A2U1J218_SMIAN|nr:hypothetical protein BB558_004907 [Smittium angustum]
MPAKKKTNKGQKMALNDFLSTTTGGDSWADDEVDLPSAPSAAPARSNLSNAPNRGDLRQDNYRSENFQPREDEPFPTEPPYNAFMENLPYDITEGDINEAFKGLNTEEVRILKNPSTGKSKGIAVVTFISPEDLTNALKLSGTQISGRSVRVSVAKKRTGQREERDFGDWRTDRREPQGGLNQREPARVSEADTNDQWRRHDAPVFADRPPRPSYRNSNQSREPLSGRGNIPPSESDANDRWRSHKEPAFNGEAPRPSINRTYGEPRPLGEQREPREPRFTSVADKNREWRRHDEPKLEPLERKVTEPAPQEKFRDQAPRKSIPISEADKNDQWRKHDPPKEILPPLEKGNSENQDAKDQSDFVEVPAKNQYKLKQSSDRSAPWRRSDGSNSEKRGINYPSEARGDRNENRRNADVPWQAQGDRQRGRSDRGRPTRPETDSTRSWRRENPLPGAVPKPLPGNTKKSEPKESEKPDFANKFSLLDVNDDQDPSGDSNADVSGEWSTVATKSRGRRN